MKPFASLDEVREALRVAIPDLEKFDFVAIRLMLRTGVNIKQPAPRHIQNPRTIARVLDVIIALGFNIHPQECS